MNYRIHTSAETVSIIELIDARYAAMVLGISTTTFRKLNIERKCPKPFKFGNAAKWWRREFMDWIDAGRPSRKDWEVIKKELGACKRHIPTEICPSQQQKPGNAVPAAIDPGAGRDGNPLGMCGTTGGVLRRGRWYGAMGCAGNGGDGRRQSMATNDATVTDDVAVLVGVDQVAAMAGVHRATVFKLVSCGKFPRPLKLGRATRWVKDELAAWFAAKCPPLGKWETMRSVPATKSWKRG